MMPTCSTTSASRSPTSTARPPSTTPSSPRSAPSASWSSRASIGYGTDFPNFWIGTEETHGDVRQEAHIAFTAPSREAVHAFRDAAVELGYEVLHEPREWPEYHPGYYGAFVRDPDGNNVEAVHHTFE